MATAILEVNKTARQLTLKRVLQMDGPEIARLIAGIGALLISAPTAFFIVRNRNAAFRNPVIWFALIGALLLVWTAIWQV